MSRKPRSQVRTFLLSSSKAVLAMLFVVGAAGCSASSETTGTVRLVTLFDADNVEQTAPMDAPEPAIWRVDGEGTVAPPEDADSFGWRVENGVEGLEVADGVLKGRITEAGFISVPVTREFGDDQVHSVEVRAKVSGAGMLGVSFSRDEEVNTGMLLGMMAEGFRPDLQTELAETDSFETYIMTMTNSTFASSFPLDGLRHLVLFPSDAADAEFEIESVRVVSRREELSSVEAGVGWHGLSEVYRETMVMRSPERVSIDVALPANPMLDLAIGTIEHGTVTFRVEADGDVLLERTVSRPDVWESVPLDLAGRGGATTLTFSVSADDDGTIGFWGTPVVRSRGSLPRVTASEARQALTDAPAPQGVILFIADTTRKDHLSAYGYERDTSPTLTSMSGDGALFMDNISPATWTKVSVPSILTSLHPRAHGITDLPDRLPSVATTLEESFQQAGYATFHTSSVPFSGKLTNLHQGVEVLHESSSVNEEGISGSKTARVFTDRFFEWLGPRGDVPFFAMIHAFDPHTPFEPYAPYDSMWTTPDLEADHAAALEKVLPLMESEFMKQQELPMQWELDEAGIDADRFVEHEHGWYDGSIRGMDAELGRILERLEQMDIADNTLVAFIADHGEEFLEHDRHWHGITAYGEMINVPLVIYWPGVIPGGLVIDEMVQSIDLMPTLLDLAGIPAPEGMHGRSLVPLMARPDDPASLGWEARPAYAERIKIAGEAPIGLETSSYVIIDDGWKLIYNFDRPDELPEYELYNHTEDPLNLDDVAADHPDIVQRLAAQLAEWSAWADTQKLSDEDMLNTMDPKEIERLKALGYIR